MLFLPRCVVIAVMVQQIMERAKEIEDLLAEVLEKERLKKEEEAERLKEEERELAELERPTVTQSLPDTLSSPQVTSPSLEDYDTIDDQVEDEVDKRFGPSDIPSKKRRNVFARMIRAVRKRFARRQRS